MKKLLYTFLAVSIIFSACEKEDNSPNNNISASIVGVWETTYANLDGTDALTSYSHVYEFFWQDGTYGSESYDLAGNLAAISVGTYSLSSNQTSLTFQIDYLDNDGDNDFTNGENININIPLLNCGRSGILSCGKALIELEGSQTNVDGNVTSGVGYMNCRPVTHRP